MIFFGYVSAWFLMFIVLIFRGRIGLVSAKKGGKVTVGQIISVSVIFSFILSVPSCVVHSAFIE